MSSPEEGPAPSGTVMRLAPWAIWLVAVALTLGTLIAFPGIPRGFTGFGYALGPIWAVTCALIGVLITSRRTGSIIGWLLLALGVVMSVGLFAARVGGTGHAAADAMNILSDVLWLVAFSLFPLIILLFPDGRPLSPRWRPVVWLVAIAPQALVLFAFAFAPQEFFSEVRVGPVQVLAGVVVIAALVTSTTSALLRFARSDGVERQQLKWFAYGTAVGIACVILGSLLGGEWGNSIANLGLFGPLAGIAVALFRHRLYDIDVLISRTFVYGSLVAILAGLYAAAVRLFNAVFVDVTGVGSEEVLVITTLVLATTFTPIKKRLEDIVERRYKKPGEEGAASPAQRSSVDIAEPAVFETIEARLRAIVRDELARSKEGTSAARGRLPTRGALSK
jgi:hypothetical protein